MFDRVLRVAARGKRSEYLLKHPCEIEDSAGVLTSVLGRIRVIREAGA